MKASTLGLSVMALTLLLDPNARAQDPNFRPRAPAPHSCVKPAGFIGGPFVATAKTARLIYIAVGEGLRPGLLKKYPIVTVEDDGGYWEVSQAQHYPKAPLKPGEVIVSVGGGQLYMKIDKCTGTIRDAAFNR